MGRVYARGSLDNGANDVATRGRAIAYDRGIAVAVRRSDSDDS